MFFLSAFQSFLIPVALVLISTSQFKILSLVKAFSSQLSSPYPTDSSVDTSNSSSIQRMHCSKTMNILTVKKILPASHPHWVGDGFHVYPVFAKYAFTNHISPWLMFDYAAPKYFQPTTRQLGVGQHPHRGFETITISFQGEVEHADSVGNGGVIGPGDVQWMTAGRGIIHEEYHSRNFAKTGGMFEMAQLWLNLPAKHKLTPPNYQAILSKDIPIVDIFDTKDSKEEGGSKTVIASLRVIAGNDILGVTGPAKTFSPVELLDISFTQSSSINKTIEIPIPTGHTVTVFVRRGSVWVGDSSQVDDKNHRQHHLLGPQAVAMLGSPDDDIVTSQNILKLTAAENGSAVMVLAGEPLNEPIAARGPFVMNTQEQLHQANQDFYSGRMGR